jgi:hypothetical protein
MRVPPLEAGKRPILIKNCIGRLICGSRRLDEQQRRWYVAVESKRIGAGGDRLLGTNHGPG